MNIYSAPVKRINKYRCISLILLAAGILCVACSPKHTPYVSACATIRDNTPICLVPEAPGVSVYEDNNVVIDYSNASSGYIMISYLGSAPLVKVQITGPDYMTYSYDIRDNNENYYPVSAGEGLYTMEIYEQIEGMTFSKLCDFEQNFSVSDEHQAFLYPNVYVKFDSDSDIVAKAKEMAAPAHDDLEAINYIYNYLIENISYDLDKANNVESGYIPDPDEILEIKKGICLDYASVMTGMLRSQRIPARMEVGYAGTAYHAWLSAYAENIGWINGIVEFDGTNWSIMDPTVASNSGEDALVSFIGDGGSYLTKYIY